MKAHQVDGSARVASDSPQASGAMGSEAPAERRPPAAIAPEAGTGAAKAALRRHYRMLRRGLRDPQGSAQDPHALLLTAARRELPALLAAGTRLAIYWPLAGEVDLRPLAALGLELALPAVLPADATQPARMVYRPWRPGEPLAPDGCGIPSPLAAAGSLAPAELGLLLAPALAFDPSSGIRLGQGGGWYDRLRADPAWGALPSLAVLPAAFLHRGLPRDPWDVPFGGWLDGEGLHRLQAA